MAFRFYTPPVINLISPSYGIFNTETQVRIDGNNFGSNSLGATCSFGTAGCVPPVRTVNLPG